MDEVNKPSIKNSDYKKKTFLAYLQSTIGTSISALLIFLAFKCFMSPSVENASVIISGGASGLSRTVALIFTMCGSKADTYLVYSITYFVLNIPSIIIGFTFGKRYGIFTLLNVGLVSLLTNFVDIPFLNELAKNVACVIKVGNSYYEPGLLIRVLLAALLNACATVTAYSSGSSAGGADTIGYYFAVKKSCSVSKPLLLINSVVITTFSILVLFSVGSNNEGVASALTTLLFAVLYQLMMNLIIDSLSKLNKKEQLQIISEKESVAKIVTTHSKHSCTIVKSRGAYSGKDKYLIYTTLTTYEIKYIVNLIRKEDPYSFINVTTIKKVYGAFIGKYNY